MDKLAEICAVKREQVAAEKAKTSFAEMDAFAREACANNPPRGFAAALRRKVGDIKKDVTPAQAGVPFGLPTKKENGMPAFAGMTEPNERNDLHSPIALICEIKKASPSAGLIRPDFDPATLARAYAQGGAACLSVLTDTPYFQGKNDYLQEARAACALPVLRKDFMIDVWQIAQSRALGADCVLLIMAALSDAQAQELHAAALSYGLDVLIETHDAEEMRRALLLPSGLIGINNRNLKTLKIDLATTEKLAPLVPEGREIVGESGIASRADIQRLMACGVSRFLIGESLMRQQDVAETTRGLVSAP